MGALRAGGDYTAMGDVVNTANRLQTAAQPGEVLVGPATYAATRRTRPLRDARADRRQGPRGARAGVAGRGGGRAARATGRSATGRALVGREPELGLLCHSVENAIRNARGVAAPRCWARPAWASPASPRSWRATPSASTTPSSSRAAASRTARPTSGGRSPTPSATAAASAPATPPTRPWRWPARPCASRWARAANAGRGRAGLPGPALPHGLRLRAARDRPGPRPRGGHLRRGHLRRAVLAPPAGRGRALRPPLGRRPRARARRHALERLSSRRFVVLATARQVVEERWHPPHGRHNLVVLTLDPLTAETRAAAARASWPAPSSATSLRRRAARPQRRQPVLPRGARHAAGRRRHGRRRRRPSEPTPASSSSPTPSAGLVAARLDGLTSDERRVLDDCAVLGRRGPMMAIEVMAGKHLGIDNVRPVLESLEAKELLVLSGTDEGEKWTFRSDLVREVAYSTLTKADRARSHAGHRRWMEAHEDSERDVVVDRITFHYVRAAELIDELGPVDGLPADLAERALHWLERAAGRAEPGRDPRRGRAPLRRGAAPPRRAARPAPPSVPHRSGPRPGGAARDRPGRGATPLAAVEESRQAGDEGRSDLGRALLVLADIEQKESGWDGLGGGPRRGEVASSPSSATRPARPRCCACAGSARCSATSTRPPPGCSSKRSPASRRSTTAAAWRGPGRTWPGARSTWGGPRRRRCCCARRPPPSRSSATRPACGWALGLLAWTRFQQGHTVEAGRDGRGHPRRRSARRRPLGARA